MSFFGKVLASIGVGSAKVDTKLHKTVFNVGEDVTGVVEVKGGSVEQVIEDIYLSVCTKYVRKSGDNTIHETGTVVRYRAADGFVIKPNETKEIDFSFELPLDTPVTQGKSSVWVHTELGISSAIDPTDNDYITVAIPPITRHVLDTVVNLGFRLRETENEYGKVRGSRLSFVQEFEFVATSGRFRGKLDELEVVVLNKSGHEAEVLLQIDRRARGLASFISEGLGADETKVSLTVTTSNLNNLEHELENLIERYS